MNDQAKQIDRWVRGLSSTWTMVGDPEQDDHWILERQDQRLFIGLNAHWLCFTLPVKPLDRESSTLHHDYLQLCRQFFLCKLSLDATGALSLQAELPLATLERGDFKQTIEGLLFYSERLGGNEPSSKPSRLRHQKSPLSSKENLLFYFGTIEHLNWVLRDDRGNGHWQAIYKGFDRSFDVYLSFDAAWVYFQTVIMSPAANSEATEKQSAPFLYTYLLELNERIHWVKFGLDQDNQILMMLEIPTRRFTLEQFQYATKAIATYANQLAFDIQIIANLRQENRIKPFLLKTLSAPVGEP